MKNTKWLKEGYFAHRGLHNKICPENTLLAFKHAVEHNFDLELDIQLTKDNLIVVCHDHTLTRLSGVDIKIGNVTYEELQKYKIRDTNETVPLFTDVLDMLPSSTKLLVELKKSNKNKLLVSLFLDTIKKYNFTYAVLSFDPRIVNLFRKNANDLIRGFIRKEKPTNSIILNFFLKVMPVIKVTKPDYIMHKLPDLPNKKVEKLIAKGIPILAYTARSKEELEYVKERYDNAVFEGFIPVPQS